MERTFRFRQGARQTIILIKTHSQSCDQESELMAEENPFQQLMRRIRAGDQDAAAELVREYEPAIRRAARVWSLDPRLRRVFDSMDICQSVFASFFVRTALGQYDLQRPD